jgi:hypothetical protein
MARPPRRTQRPTTTGNEAPTARQLCFIARLTREYPLPAPTFPNSRRAASDLIDELLDQIPPKSKAKIRTAQGRSEKKRQ